MPLLARASRHGRKLKSISKVDRHEVWEAVCDAYQYPLDLPLHLKERSHLLRAESSVR